MRKCFTCLVISVVLSGLAPLSGLWLSNAFAAGVSTGSLTAIPPARILDTRGSLGGRDGRPLGAGETVTLRVLGAVAPLSAIATPISAAPPAGVSAVLVNVTVVSPTAQSGYLTVFPSGSGRPTASTLNYRANATLANSALVPVGGNGTISIFNSNGSTHVLLDVEGWVGVDNNPGAAKITSTTATRILDSRGPVGGRNGTPLGAGETMRLPVLGVAGLPLTGVSSVLINVTAVPSQGGGGYLTAFPSGVARPLASTLNFNPGVTVANFAAVPVGGDGAISVYGTAANTHVVIDVGGWVAAGDPTRHGGTQAVRADRVLDSRGPLGGRNGAPLRAGETMRLPVLGVGGVPATGVASVLLHVTSVNSTVGGHFTVYPSTERRPVSSSVNFTANATVSNTLTVPVGPDGAVAIYNYAGSSHVVADVQGWTARQVLDAVGPRPEALTGGPLTAPDSVRAAEILGNANRYAMTTWWADVAPELLTAPVSTSGAANEALRRMGMEAVSLSTALATETYDAAFTGVSAATATTRTIQLIDRVSGTHISNQPAGWGRSWQSGLWAAYGGKAAWLLWSRIDGPTQRNVARMMEYEADYAAGWQSRYLRDATGNIISAGDSHSDDSSWNAMPLQLASVMLPNHPHTPVWNHAMVQLNLASWARPADVARTTIVNGATLATWLDGSNVEANGTVINHKRVAPDYSTLIYQNMEGILTNALAGRPAPRAAVTLIPPVYAAFRSVTYTAPPYNAPGGQIYTDSATIYYPQGIGWGPGQMIPYALVDAQTAAFGVGSNTSADYEALHADAQLAMQGRFSDGHTYSGPSEYNFVGREEHAAQLASQLFLTKWVRDRALFGFTDASFWIPAN